MPAVFSNRPLVLPGIPYLPPVWWFVNVLSNSPVRLLEGLPYTRKLHLQQARLAGPGGVVKLSVPVCSESRTVAEARIDVQQPWQKVHWQTIQSLYGRSPFFPYYADEIKELLMQPPGTLAAFNRELFSCLCRQMKYPVPDIEMIRLEGADIFNSIRQLARLETECGHPAYPQVFQSRTGFLPGLSVLDLLMNQGPAAAPYLQKLIAG